MSASSVLLLHGHGLDQSYLRAGHDPLNARLTYVDQRVDVQLADFVDLIDRDTIVIAHSSASWMMLEYAQRYPVRGLVLSGCAPAFDYPDVVVANAKRRDPVLADKLVAGLTSPPTSDEAYKQIWLEVLPLYFVGAPQRALIEHCRFSGRQHIHAHATFKGVPLASDLRAITVPILAITGRQDFITPPEQAERIAASAPNARAAIIEDAGHFAFAEQPIAYRAAIADWMASL
ncbi:MAG: alpha/beta hydrolase [Kofleriaceae bacterium]